MNRRSLRAKAVGAALGLSCLVSWAAVHATGSVVARVGTQEIALDEVHKRLAQAPLFQLKNMGDTPDQIRHRFVEELVELEMMVQGARLRELDRAPEVDERIRSVLVSALFDELASEAGKAGAISEERIRAYYDENRDKYQAQQRILIWQIAVQTEQEAQKLLDTIKNGAEFRDESTFVEAWDKLARENSIDKSTHMRKGNLGFVHPDGSTHHKDVRVPKALYDAAATIEDGEVYPKPMQVESFWVVFARRGSMMTPERTLESERATIRAFLAREHVTHSRKQLLERLRESHVQEKNERVLDQLEISEDDVAVARRPGALREARAPRGSVKPVGRPGNLR